MNFPNSPNVGDTYTPAGGAATWQWNGTAWVVVGGETGGEANYGSNVGAGAGQLVRGKTNQSIDIKTLRSSDASVGITDEADTVDLTVSGLTGGTLREVQKDGATVLDGGTVLDFRATGDASVSVTDQGAGVVRIVIDATAGAGGGGIGKGTPFVVGHIMAAESDVGDGSAETVGYGPADIARVDIANTFALGQTINVPAAAASLLLQAGGSNVAYLDLFPGSGAVNARRYWLNGSGGNLFIGSLDDAGAPVETIQTFSHVGGVSVGSPTGGAPSTRGHHNVEKAFENNVPLLFPTATDYSGTVINLAFNGSPWARLTEPTAGITINPPSSGEGELSVLVKGTGSVTLGAFTTVRGTEPAAAANRIGYVMRDSAGDTLWMWGAE